MDKVVITSGLVGICHMQVCVNEGVADEEILEVCNRRNPSGTSNGWSEVHRRTDEKRKAQGPVPCADDPGRAHLLVSC